MPFLEIILGIDVVISVHFQYSYKTENALLILHALK